MDNEQKRLQNLVELEKDIEAILESIHDDVLITDGKGVIIRVSPSFEKLYHVAGNEVLGKTVYDLQERGVFKPSVTAIVLETGEKVTMLQENQFQRQIVVTATPVKDAKGTIKKVVSFSRDMTDYIHLKQQYEQLENDVKRYTAEIKELKNKKLSFPGVIGKTEKMQQILSLMNKVAQFDANVLLLGESGVGKSMFAGLIHQRSNRSEGPFIEINCGAIPETLLESELFGYEKGAFTGANRDGKIGLIELAEKGTLFLDEISELSLNLQTKLLKVIQDKTFHRIGGNKLIRVDFRLIAATNKDLKKLVETKKFRDDLYYRLHVITIQIPPLRDRSEDIMPLSLHFVQKLNSQYGLNKSLSANAINKLMHYHWPGNIRELENILERVILTYDHEIITDEALPIITEEESQSYLRCECANLQEALDGLEGRIIKEAYEKHGTTVGVAKELGISQPTAVRKIKKHAYLFKNEYTI